jgi:hypothetical protein
MKQRRGNKPVLFLWTHSQLGAQSDGRRPIPGRVARPFASFLLDTDTEREYPPQIDHAQCHQQQHGEDDRELDQRLAASSAEVTLGADC